MTRIPSFTWAGGELAEELYGRVDLNKYQTGLKRCRNAFVQVEGGVTKRPGFYLVGKPKFDNENSRLVPFFIANDDSYILEFGHQYIRFIRFGGYVEYPPGHVPLAESDAISVSGLLEVPTGYTAAQVSGLKFAFANDVVFIFHPTEPVRLLKRLGLFDWDFGDYSFDPHPDAPTGGTATFEGEGDLEPEDNYEVVPQTYQYKISWTGLDGVESKPTDPIFVDADLGHKKLTVLVDWDAVTGAQQYTVYKGANGIFGFIGYTDSATTEFRDTNLAPSYDVVPVANWNGFNDGQAPEQYPRCGQFYKQRLMYAATARDPSRLWASRALVFNSMATSVPVQDDDPFNYTLVGNSKQTILHMLQLKKFLIFTDAGEWVLNTVGNEALSPSTIDPIMESAYGIHPRLEPMGIGDRVLFVQDISNSIMDMGYEYVSNSYQADNLTRLAVHLFRNKTLKAWDYADYPYSVVFMATDDGKLPHMTYVRQHEIWGWGQSETQGDFLDVACVSENNQDAVYVRTRRRLGDVVTYFVERMAVRQNASLPDSFHVDCGLSFYVPTFFNLFDRVSDTVVTITHTGHAVAVDDEIQLEIGDHRDRYIVTAVTGTTFTMELKYDREVPTNLEGVDGIYFICADRLTGFNHLIGSSDLVGLLDGKVVTGLEVDNLGEIQLPFFAARAHIGFGYAMELETLSLDPQQLAGRYQERTIDRITTRLKDAGDVTVGTSISSRELVPLDERGAGPMDQPAPLLNGVYDLPAHLEWGMEASVVLRSEAPVPCTVLNIVPEIKYGTD